MDSPNPDVATDSSVIRFGAVVVDFGNYELIRDGQTVSIEPQVFDVLRYLIEHRDRVVGKEELLDNVWGNRFVSESALSSRIKSARQAVGDDGRRQEVIKTTHGRGYRFVAALDEAPDASQDDLARGSSNEPSHRPVERRPSTVPAPARPLVARDDEYDELVELLAANRMVTLVGPGGVGKTRLAIEVATRWDQSSGGAATFVGLAAVAGPDEVFVAIRDALGIAGSASADAFGAVGEALSGDSALLVLDNFEHVIESSTDLAELVKSVPGLWLLVTSRERLGLAGEQVLELQPLSVAADGSTVGSAVTFFEHAVRGVGSAVDLDIDGRDDAAAICRTLDGLPLAIELAAAQTRYFSLAYLRSHLESAAITVADHARDRPERHHTMESTMAWSYRLLTPNQQKLLAMLSVYKGAWPLAAADAMVEAEAPGAAAHDLFALVDKSLVQRSDGGVGEPRFSMLNLLRDFAWERLESSGLRDQAQARHARFLTETVQSLESRRWGDSGDGWIEAIHAVYPDTVAALTWCFDGGDPALGCRIARALGFWWYRSGRHGEGRVWIDHGLAQASSADDSTMAWIHAAAGSLAKYELRREVCLDHFGQALSLARQVGDERLEALGLCDLGAATAGHPDGYESGLEMLQLGLDHARRLQSPQVVAHGLTVLGELTRGNGDPKQAESAYREALDLNAQLGDRHYEAVNTLNMGHALMAQDRMHEALSYHRRGIELSTRIGSRLMMAWNLSALATAHHLLGDPQLSARVVGAAQATLDVLGATYGPVDQPVHERRQEALRDDLGDDQYARLVAEGRQLRLETGIELALDALGSEPD